MVEGVEECGGRGRGDVVGGVRFVVQGVEE